jgi:hypothetical protein
MNTLHERVEALEKFGAGALADQALLKLVRLHLQKYEKHLADVQKELESSEQQDGISSEECYRRFNEGEMGDAADISPVPSMPDVSPRGVAPTCDQKKSLRSPAWLQNSDYSPLLRCACT